MPSPTRPLSAEDAKSVKALKGLWRRMHQRCYDSKVLEYAAYGGKGVTVNERWHVFENFLEDMWPRPEGMTLERQDNMKGYDPSNVVWASRKQQTRNRDCSLKLTFKGETKTLAEWAELTGIRYHTLKARVQRLGYSAEQALSKNVKPGAKLEDKVYAERRKPDMSKIPKGFAHANARITKEKVKAIQADFETLKLSYSALALKFGIAIETASRICNREGHYDIKD